MKKNIIWLIILFIVILIGGIIFTLTNIKEDTSEQEQEELNTSDSQENIIDETGDENMETNTKISLNINGKDFTAKLEDSETTRKLVEMLPLEINMSELNGNEKYYYLDSNLPTNQYNPRHIKAGDIMLYGNNCLVIFYEDFDTSYSYTKIGKIENIDGLKSSLGRGSINVLIEKND